MDKKLITLCSFFVVVVIIIIACGAKSIGNDRQKIVETQRIEQKRIKQQEWEDNAPIRAEAERQRIAKAEQERKAVIARQIQKDTSQKFRAERIAQEPSRWVTESQQWWFEMLIGLHDGEFIPFSDDWLSKTPAQQEQVLREPKRQAEEWARQQD